jgi:glucokinase
LAERARAAAVAGTADDLLTHAGVPARCLTAEHVVAAAHAGCIPALRLIEQAADCLGYALIGIAVTVEPAVIYLSGSLGHAAADLLIPRIAARMDEQWPFGAEVPRPTILLDQAGPLAGALGAGLLARDIRAHARNPTREATPVAEPS